MECNTSIQTFVSTTSAALSLFRKSIAGLWCIFIIMGCFPGKPVDTSTSEYITIENRYHQTIKVKFEFDRPIAQEYEAGGGGKVGAMGFNLGAKGYKMERKEWDLIKTEFTSIKHAHFFPRKANIKDKVYLTVVTDDQEVNIHTWLIEANTNLIISEQGELQITTAKTKTKDTETDIRKAESKRYENVFRYANLFCSRGLTNVFLLTMVYND